MVVSGILRPHSVTESTVRNPSPRMCPGRVQDPDRPFPVSEWYGRYGTPSSLCYGKTAWVNRTGPVYLTSYYVTRHNTFSGLTRRVSWSRNPDRYRFGSSFGCSLFPSSFGTGPVVGHPGRPHPPTVRDHHTEVREWVVRHESVTRQRVSYPPD